MPLSATRHACAHCSLPVPDGLVQPSEARQFCCRGCATAHALIHARGLQGYYALPDRGASRAATADAEVRYAELDRPSFLAAHTTELPGGQRRATLGIDGIHCAACLWLLERLPRVVPGVIEARVNWRKSTIDVRWSATNVALSDVADGIAGLGYRPHPLRVDTRAQQRRADDRQRMIAIGVAFAAAGNNMLIAVSLYLGLFSYMDQGITELLRWGSCVVGLVSLSWPGRVFFKGAASAIRSRTPHMDLPVALALGVGGIAGLVNTIRGSGELYFDTLSVLVFLLLVGRSIQIRQQRQAAAALDVLFRVTPRMAHRLVDGGFAEVPADVLQPGDIVRIDATQTVPGDGVVIAGTSSVDEQVLTGEARPVAVRPGSTVAAGTVNLGGSLQVRIESVAEHTRMGRVLELVERSADSRPPIVAMADRIGGWFVVTVVGIAVATAVGWLVLDARVAVDHAVALLIVACPCALALATPLTIAVALGRAAQARILVKGGDVLQRLSGAGTIWLDKTGTLTEGRMAVVDFDGDVAITAAVGAVERHSQHPVARALHAWATETSDGTPSTTTATGVSQSAAGGIEGTVDGRAVVIGNAAYVGRRSPGSVPAHLRTSASRMVATGASPVYVAVDGQTVAVIGVGDPVRSDARAVVEQLSGDGWRVGILSGDHPDVVHAVGRALGLPASRCHGGLTPEDKVDMIRRSQATDEPVVMVGDGINDSAALAAASVGIAARDGAEASLQAAPVYLGQPGLHGLVDLLDRSRAAMRAIRRTFFVSLAYNALAVGLAAAGLVSPLLAAVLMPMSSLTVVGMALAQRGAPA